MGVTPSRIIIDVFGLYSIFKQTPSYAHKKGSIVLLELEEHQTTLSYVYDGALRSVRTIPKGINDVAVIMGQKLNIDAQAIIEHLFAGG